MATTITILLGAGASMDAGIPNVYEFYSAFKENIEEVFGAQHALSKEIDRLQMAWKDTTGDDLTDLERFYELLTFINGTTLHPSIPLRLPKALETRSREIELLEWELKKYVQQRCLDIRRKDLDYLEPLLEFASLSRPLTIISLNYDPCIEILLDSARASWSDGGPPGDKEFPANRLTFPESAGFHLIKLHGSATWYKAGSADEAGRMRRVRAAGQVEVARRMGAARTLTHEAMVIYPTLNKALTNGPFPSLAVAAEKALSESRLCLAIGYSFGDAHIRRLVLEALSSNPDLKLVLVNPAALQVLPALYGESSTSVHSRIGMVRDPERYGKVKSALEEGWLLKRSREWIGGEPLNLPFGPTCGKMGGSGTPFKSQSPWRLRYPVEGGVAGIARWKGSLYIVLRVEQAIGELNMATGEIRIVAKGFKNLRGLAIDPVSERLFVISNRYWSWIPGALWSRGGIGQLWAVDLISGAKRAMTRIHWPRTLIRLARPGRGSQNAPWKRLVGGLRWPTSVAVREPGCTLLFTEARAVRELSLKKKRISTPLEIPLPFNVVGLALEDDGTILIADAGVHPNGFGRLMRGRLGERSVEILASGWKRVGSLAFLPNRRLALLSQGGAWPRGKVFALDVDEPDQEPEYLWEGLNEPSHLSYCRETDEILVSTKDGIVELTLH
jgi:hypothetical protein